MAERTWMSGISERAFFSEEAVLTMRRKMRAVSLLAGLPIVCLLDNFQNSNSLEGFQLANNSGSSSSTTDSSTDNDDNLRTMTATSGKGQHMKTEEDQDQNHEGVQCVICLYNICKGEKYRVLEECSHGFHVDCIDAWLLQNSTCPLCRCLVAYTPAGEKQQQQLSGRNRNDVQEAYYEAAIASILCFLDHLWTWFLNPLGLDQSCQDYHAYL
ncbi:uncharacterized protein [Coffea arabica]|uniref:RING-type domain-containing protein n=1 Tax=Coffea arabica TaxID=13443 RepID=A0A6P6V646_COFAR|nr:E3 ubiquitin-protein ligase ATL4-like [Coffea arabica]